MDDDLTFGASVWGSSNLAEPTSSVKMTSTTLSQVDGGEPALDDFDDFGEPEEMNQDSSREDDFGDFGDFGEASTSTSMTFGDSVNFQDDIRIARPSSENWRPLLLDPLPPRRSLEQELDKILGHVWGTGSISDITIDEPIREAEGVLQILVTPSSRDVYKTLLQTSPTKLSNWTRSRIRRQHLISLGIPVNLDEVLPRANGKPLPVLEIHTRPMSAPPGGRNQYPNTNSGTGPNTRNNSRAGTPVPGQQGVYSHLGPKPELDINRINKLLQLKHESLAMQPLVTLERYLADIKAQTANTSDLLRHLLQTREALQQDSEMYNGLIAEMVGEAQKLKSGKPTRTGSMRRGSGLV